MAENVNPGTMAGARELAKAGQAGDPEHIKLHKRCNGTRVAFESPNGPKAVCLKGRALWALRELVRAGDAGVTPIEWVGPRWSHYVFLLRGEGIDIETIREPHGGDYPGHHGRYVLRTSVAIGGGA